MSRTTTLTVRLSGALSEFVAAKFSEDGSYENVSDLIRRDKQRAEQEAFDRLKAELTQAFASPDSTFGELTAADVIARNQR